MTMPGQQLEQESQKWVAPTCMKNEDLLSLEEGVVPILASFNWFSLVHF